MITESLTIKSQGATCQCLIIESCSSGVMMEVTDYTNEINSALLPAKWKMQGEGS